MPNRKSPSAIVSRCMWTARWEVPTRRFVAVRRGARYLFEEAPTVVGRLIPRLIWVVLGVVVVLALVEYLARYH